MDAGSGMPGKICTLLFMGLVSLTIPSVFAAGDAALGKQLYLYGLLDSGKPITATGAGGSPLDGRQDTCQSCHRRSGLGSSEGGTQIPAISGDILFQTRTRSDRELQKVRLEGPGARPAYDRETLLRAITQGIDVNGRAMHPLMPRYRLSRSNYDNLVAYLNTLDASHAPGVLPEQIIVATVFTPDVESAQRTAVVKTLETFFRLHNNQTRGEKRRAEHTPWHKSWEYTSYRDFQLLTWELQGPAADWPRQLHRLYSQQPVYAIINGIGYDNWKPVHQFCEQVKIPCLFPTTDNPVVSASDFYSVYFSGGVTLEANSLATYIKTSSHGDLRILQIHRDTHKGQTAARTLQQNLADAGYRFETLSIPPTADLASAIRRLPAEKPYDFLVLWLNDADIASIVKSIKPDRYGKLVLSTGFSSKPELPPEVKTKTFTLSRFIPPAEHKRHLIRATMWAKHYQIDLSNERIVSNAYFSAVLFSKAVQSMRAYLSREHLIERIEHIMERNVFHSVFPELQLSPDQRFASKGCYITGPMTAKAGRDYIHQWIVPNLGH